jgi:hypothetical protein
MASSKRMPDPEEPDLTSHTDFQLLNALTDLVSKENSKRLKLIAWEIMRRYSIHLDKPDPTKSKDCNTILGDSRWGDAKRVEVIFGLKRGVLNSLRESKLIISKSLDEGRDGKRAKRLYDLLSIQSYLYNEQ